MARILTNHGPFKFSPFATSIHRYIRRNAHWLLLTPPFLWRFMASRPAPILVQPFDFHLADPEKAKDFYHSEFALAGRVVKAGALSPFALEPPSQAWEIALHNFSWLRHLEAANSALASAHARSLLEDWLRYIPLKISALSWRGDVVGQRLSAWLSHSSMLLKGASPEFKKKFLRSLNFQCHYLCNLLPTMGNNHQALQAHIGASFAALALDLPIKKKHSILQRLEKILAQQILPDGGHISRNPALLLDLLTDLLALRYSFSAKGETPPPLLLHSIERMLPALRFFLHEDGSLARFNGVGPIHAQQLENIFKWDETGGNPFRYAPHSGYQRLSFNHTTLIADIGAPPKREASHQANAGCLAFEMSSGQHSFIINAGIDPFSLENYAFLGRLTAAHSTATLNETSSCLFAKHKNNIDVPLMRGPDQISISRIDDEECSGFIASHNGYQTRFNWIHERGILLHKDGKIIHGFDHFFTPDREKGANNGRDHIAIRFHLHPDVEISYDKGGNLRLEVMGGDSWLFSSPDVAGQLEDSVYFADIKGPRKTKQIVLSFRPSLIAKIRWRFIRICQKI